MATKNEYRILRDATWANNKPVMKKNDAIIIERTDDGIIYLWPLFPKCLEDNEALLEHQDLNDYLADGAWLVSDPWMYFDRLDDVMPLLIQQPASLEHIDLGWLSSIRDARAKALVFLSLMQEPQ